MDTIVVAADGSAGANNALRWAGHLARDRDAKLVVMNGFVPTESELPPGRVEKLAAERERLVDGWIDAAQIGGPTVRTVIERGDPRPGLLRVADREDADLVVVGRIGHSAGPGLLHIGSMAEWLAHHTTRPLAVVGGAVSVDTRSVLVAVDGSPGSQAAVDWVLASTGTPGLRVVAATVDQMFVEWSPSDPEQWRPALEQRIREELAPELTDAPIELVTLALRAPNVADALLQAAKDERTDVIVVGTRGLGGFSELRIGGVALKILHRTDRPVVLVPPAE